MKRSTHACLWRSIFKRARRHGRLFAVAAAWAVFGAGCAGQLPVPGTEQARTASRWWPDVTTEQLALGRSLYIKRCSGCHALILPSKHSPQSWEASVIKMAPAAKLGAEEISAISRYLAVTSSEKRGEQVR